MMLSCAFQMCISGPQSSFIGQGQAARRPFYAPGKMTGTEVIQLTPNQLSAHLHEYHQATINTTKQSVRTGPGVKAFTSVTQKSIAPPSSTSVAGGGVAFTNMQPLIVLTSAIRAQDIYPEHP